MYIYLLLYNRSNSDLVKFQNGGTSLPFRTKYIATVILFLSNSVGSCFH